MVSGESCGYSSPLSAGVYWYYYMYIAVYLRGTGRLDRFKNELIDSMWYMLQSWGKSMLALRFVRQERVQSAAFVNQIECCNVIKGRCMDIGDLLRWAIITILLLHAHCCSAEPFFFLLSTFLLCGAFVFYAERFSSLPSVFFFFFCSTKQCPSLPSNFYSLPSPVLLCCAFSFSAE